MMSAPSNYSSHESSAAVEPLCKEIAELKRQLAEKSKEKSDIDKYVKVKEGQVKELGEKSEEKDREIEQLKAELNINHDQLKKTTLELMEYTDRVTTTHQENKQLQEENDLLRVKVISEMERLVEVNEQLRRAEEKLCTATNPIEQCKEEKKTTTNTRTSRLRNRAASFIKELTDPEPRQSTASATAGGSGGQSEEEQILTAQVNAYSRECDKLKRQLATANEEIDSLRKQLEQTCSELEKEQKKSEDLSERLNEMSETNEKSLRANKTLREKLIASEAELMKQKDPQQPGQSIISDTGSTTDSVNGQTANGVVSSPPVAQQVLLDKEREEHDMKLQLLEEESERKRLEADKALQDIEDTRRELINKKVNFDSVQVAQNAATVIKSSGTASEQSTVDDRSSPVPSTSDSDSDDIPENKLIQGIDQEIQYYAGEVRKMSRRPSTREVQESDDLPHDPNLVCPKCGKRYRIGGVQKFRRHVKELCTANSSP